jgi:hypothetical protein
MARFCHRKPRACATSTKSWAISCHTLPVLPSRSTEDMTVMTIARLANNTLFIALL